jgi:hypothetical protein
MFDSELLTVSSVLTEIVCIIKIFALEGFFVNGCQDLDFCLDNDIQ